MLVLLSLVLSACASQSSIRGASTAPDNPGKAKAIAELRGQRVTLYDGPCQFKHVVDFEFRSTWDADGKHYEGCWNPYPFGVIGVYSDDKSFAIIPMQAFRPLQEG